MSPWPDHDQILAFLEANLAGADRCQYRVLSEEQSGMLNDILVLERKPGAGGGTETARIGIRAPKQKLAQRMGRPATDVYACVAATWPYLENNGVPVPRLLLAVGPGTIFERPCHVFEWVAGARLCDRYADMEPNERRRVLGQVAAGMARLHRIGPETVGSTLAGRLGRPDSASTAEAESLAARLTSHESTLDALAPAWRDALTLLQSAKSMRQRQTLTHGDFYIGNVLVQGTDLAGIIDWDAIALDDPAKDIVAFLRGDAHPLGVEAGRDAFFEAYRSNGGTIPDSLLHHEIRYFLTLCAIELSQAEHEPDAAATRLADALAARLDASEFKPSHRQDR